MLMLQGLINMEDRALTLHEDRQGDLVSSRPPSWKTSNAYFEKENHRSQPLVVMITK